ncbi:nucleolar protein 7/estrogen receptor coactivator-related [Anaeramoeba flamelloides]|uniref:Oxidation resistance protein 1 n=1 Tax=Anaeramoeba flamelloides TaxID=1746091 RepID=A0ABQ8XBG8_9EUKA|nr:nucleolar protein 7/estrogen receptor coactivator-related [Anaeramoeba flamelloides]
MEKTENQTNQEKEKKEKTKPTIETKPKPKTKPKTEEKKKKKMEEKLLITNKSQLDPDVIIYSLSKNESLESLFKKFRITFTELQKLNPNLNKDNVSSFHQIFVRRPKEEKKKEKKKQEITRKKSVEKNVVKEKEKEMILNKNNKVLTNKQNELYTFKITFWTSKWACDGTLSFTSEYFIFAPSLDGVEDNLLSKIQKKAWVGVSFNALVDCQLYPHPPNFNELEQDSLQIIESPLDKRLIQILVKDHGIVHFSGKTSLLEEISKILINMMNTAHENREQEIKIFLENLKEMEKKMNRKKKKKKNKNQKKEKEKYNENEKEKAKGKGKGIENQKEAHSKIHMFSKIFTRNKSTNNIKKQEKEKELENEYFSAMSSDSDSFLPQLKGKTKILNNEYIEYIYPLLPSFLSQSDWKLLFSTEKHGISLITFYELTSKVTTSLIFIKTVNGEVIGAFIPIRIKISKNFYGKSSGFIFSLSPTPQYFRWTGKNDYFILTTQKSISFGGGSNYGIWISADLTDGSTNYCETYDNKKLSQISNFQIAQIEVWSFVYR